MTVRVLVVDDSAPVRRIVTQALSAHPELEVAGVARNGQEALDKLDVLQPDAVTLDIEMPVLSGLDTLPKLREKYPRLPVIMFSTLTEKGARATLEALARGASTYVTKPSNTSSLQEAQEEIQQKLADHILSLCKRVPPPVAPPEEPAQAAPRPAPTRVDVLAIGVSTGGPNALAKVFEDLPEDLPVPIVIVQHMPPLFTKLLAERLDKGSKISVVEAEPGMALEPGKAILASGGKHMVLEKFGTKVVVQTNEDPPENSCRPAVDPLFRSVERIYRSRALVTMLTGMGRDGLEGTRGLFHKGAQVIAQDEETSVVWGMPAALVRNNLTDVVLPLDQIAEEITRRCWEQRSDRKSIPSPRPGVSTT